MATKKKVITKKKVTKKKTVVRPKAKQKRKLKAGDVIIDNHYYGCEEMPDGLLIQRYDSIENLKAWAGCSPDRRILPAGDPLIIDAKTLSDTFPVKIPSG